MSAPLTMREALVEVITEHWADCGADYDLRGCGCGWSHEGTYEAHLADALLAGDFWTRLAEDEALVERVARDLFKFTPDYAEHSEVRRYLTALAAALSPQSERAEVER